MAAVEIDETELQSLRSVKTTLEAWMQNPKARKKILEARKEFDPNAVIPELDAAKPLEDAQTALRKELDDFRSEINKEREERANSEKLSLLNRQFESGRQKLRASGYTEEGIKKVEDLMEKEGIANHEAAAAYYDRLNPPELPVAPQNSGFDMLLNTMSAQTDPAAEASRKALFENPDMWAAGEVNRVLSETRRK